MKEKAPRPNVRKEPTIQDQALVVYKDLDAMRGKIPPTKQWIVDRWDALAEFIQQAEKKKEEEYRPHKDKADAVTKAYRPLLTELNQYHDLATTLLRAFEHEEKRKEDEAHALIEAKLNEQNAKILANAEKKGIEPVLKASPPMESTFASKQLQTQAGTTVQRSTVKRWRIKHNGGYLLPDEIVSHYANHPALEKIDRQYLRVDTKKISTDMNLGRIEELNAQGIEVYEEFQYSQR